MFCDFKNLLRGEGQGNGYMDQVFTKLFIIIIIIFVFVHAFYQSV